MAIWTTELEARVEVDEELKGALMEALVTAFPEPKPALVFSSGRLLARLEVEADHELEAARLAADSFAKAMEKAILALLPLVERLEKRRLPRRKTGSSERSRPAVSGPAHIESCASCRELAQRLPKALEAVAAVPVTEVRFVGRQGIGHASVATTARYDRRDHAKQGKAAAQLHAPYVPLEE